MASRELTAFSMKSLVSFTVVGLLAACSGPVDLGKRPYGADAGTLAQLPPSGFGDGGVVLPAGTCPPKTPTTQTLPPWQPPHALRRNVCTPDEAIAIVTCFLQKQNCDAKVSAKCHQCTVSSPTDAVAGPLIVSGPEDIELNVEGCVAAMQGDTSAAGCGPKIQAHFLCQSAACGTCPDENGFYACLDSADKTVCAAQAAAATCAAPFQEKCAAGASELEVAFNLVKVFCGP